MQAFFLSEMSLIGGVIFHQPCHHGIGVLHHKLVKFEFLSQNPILDELLVFNTVALILSYGEVTIAEGFSVQTSFNIIGVHAEGTEHDFAIVLPQEMKEGLISLGFQRNKDGIYQLNDVKAFESGELALQMKEIAQRIPFLERGAMQINVARIVLPLVAIRCHHHVMPELAKPECESGVHVAEFAEQKDSHG